MTTGDDAPWLAVALSWRTRQLSAGLARGSAEILDLATPTTAALLRWWFGDAACRARALNFLPSQRQAILNTIVAHEILGSLDLADLYLQVCPRMVFAGDLPPEASIESNAHPKYCLNLPSGIGKIRVLQALLLWQLLNRTAAIAKHRDDVRFSRSFLLCVADADGCEELVGAFLGQCGPDGTRDFATSALVAHSELLLPPAWRHRVWLFVHDGVRTPADIGFAPGHDGFVAINRRDRLVDPGAERPDATMASGPRHAMGSAVAKPNHRYRLRDRLAEHLAALPDLVVFDYEKPSDCTIASAERPAEPGWHKTMTRLAAAKGRRFVQIDLPTSLSRKGFGAAAPRPPASAHVIADSDLHAAMHRG